jgi:hypothetical protein
LRRAARPPEGSGRELHALWPCYDDMSGREPARFTSWPGLRHTTSPTMATTFSSRRSPRADAVGRPCRGLRAARPRSHAHIGRAHGAQPVDPITRRERRRTHKHSRLAANGHKCSAMSQKS